MPPDLDDDLKSWLRLVSTPGVGRIKARRLLAALGSPQAVFDAPRSTLTELVDARAAAALHALPANLDTLWERTRAWLSDTPAGAVPRSLLTLGDPRYPRVLLELADPPMLLHALGRVDLLDRPLLAVVGSRHATAQGLEHARAFCRDLSRQGVCIVSGLALGIDAAAHEGALDGSGSTIAVVGTGLDRLYPRQNLTLAQHIAERGLVLSEFVLGTAAHASHFPQRNRIIAGLSLGTLVVEATLESGSLITARLALESGREVLAIPGSIHSPQSRGCHALIKQGAKLVECTQDILDELNLRTASPTVGLVASSSTCPAAGESDSETSDDADTDPILAALGWSPATLDVLQIRTGWSTSDLTVRLLELELTGAVARLPGQIFQRLAQA